MKLKKVENMGYKSSLNGVKQEHFIIFENLAKAFDMDFKATRQKKS